VCDHDAEPAALQALAFVTAEIYVSGTALAIDAASAALLAIIEYGWHFNRYDRIFLRQ
jgi:hypothetical protein